MSAPATSAPDLSLYMFPGCPYCARVERALDAYGVEVERRDVHGPGDHMLDLVAARGRKTVPVLRIDAPDGTSRWLPESADIVDYLADRFGDGQPPPLTWGQRLFDARWALVGFGVGVAMARALGWI
jgi:glutathione S-transferase